MLSRWHLHLVLLLGAIVGAGCAPSLVYNPAVSLPSRPLIKEQGEAIGTLGFLPETRPHQSGTTSHVSGGGALTLRYAFSNRLTLGVSAWSDLQDFFNGYFRGGFGAEAIFPIAGGGDPDPNGMKLGLMPRTAVLFDGGSIEGGGFAIPVVLWLPKTDLFATYAALGPALGYRDLSTAPAQWGYGLIGNLGTSITLGSSFRIYAEVAGIVQVNQYDRITHGVFAPSVGLALTF